MFLGRNIGRGVKVDQINKLAILDLDDQFSTEQGVDKYENGIKI
jgi:hypothetical protein